MRTMILTDGDNITKDEAPFMQYGALFAHYGDSNVVRCVAYFSFEPNESDEQKRKRERFYTALRMKRVNVISMTRHVRTYPDGTTVVKGFPDAGIAFDAARWSHDVDRVVLITGDRDYLPVVEGLQQLGKYVEVIGFRSVSDRLRLAANRYVSGYSIPGLVPAAPQAA